MAKNTLSYPKNIRRLLEIHTYKRPHNTPTVTEFVDKLLVTPYKHLDPYTLHETLPDGTQGQPLCVVIETDPSSKTMFSAHVDTVHHTHGRQVLAYDHEMGLLHKAQDPAVKDNECLGADDGAGIWLMLEMIDANVPGSFYFFYGEERGGIGSSLLAKQQPLLLKTFERAIAFDRKGTQDVITHQGWERCCSDTFAKALAESLNMQGQQLSMRPDDGGIFTDTANFVDDIPECTNISIGYDGAHTPGESLDVEYLVRLRAAVISCDWDTLPTVRDPSVKEAPSYAYSGWYQGTKANYVQDFTEIDDVMCMQYGALVDYVKKADARDVAEVIQELVDRLYAAEDELAMRGAETDYPNYIGEI